MKRFLKTMSIILCFAIMLSSLGFFAFAEDETGEETAVAYQKNFINYADDYFDTLSEVFINGVAAMEQSIVFPIYGSLFGGFIQPQFLTVPLCFIISIPIGLLMFVYGLFITVASPVISLFYFK